MKSDASYAQFVVERMLPLIQGLEGHAAAISNSHDPRHLHRIRVLMRRLRDTMRIFKGFFPAAERKNWDHHLRKVSKISSRGRDIDVQIQFLERYRRAVAPRKDKNDILVLKNRFIRRRQQLQPQILRSLRHLFRCGILGQIQAALQAKAKTKKTPFDYLYLIGWAALSRRVAKELALESCVDLSRAVRELHQLRIANKHLRYAMETLREIYTPEIDRFLEPVVFFHRTLGEMHDYDVWLRLITDLQRDHRKARAVRAHENLKKHCEERRAECYNTFQHSWHLKRAHLFFEDLLGYVYSCSVR